MQTLDALAAQALALTIESPRAGWEMMSEIEASLRQQTDGFSAAVAAWHLGRLACEYGRPKLVMEALDRAEPIFTALGERDWLAAVSWLRHGLPWAADNLSESIVALESAVETLENSSLPLSDFAPYCRLTLAYAKVLTGSFDHLPELIDACRNDFNHNGDELALARTIFVHSALLRRTAPLETALAATNEGLALAQSLGAEADAARFHCQAGFNFWLGKGDYDLAAQSFRRGIKMFEQLNIPGWQAQCLNGLAQVFIMTGRLTTAEPHLHAAQALFMGESVISQQASVMLNLAWLEREKGNYQLSLDYIKKVQAYYKQSGNDPLVAVAETIWGETCIEFGRFQEGLRYLEKAYGRLKGLNLPSRLAECALRLARLWTILDHPEQARYYLEKVRKEAEKVNHISALLSYHLRIAEYHHNQSAFQQAHDSLKTALLLADSQNNHGAVALCHRALARNFAQQQRFDEAVESLALADRLIHDLGLRHEKAACQLIWGDIYRQQGKENYARLAFLEAAKLSKNLMPDLNWQATAGLAALAEEAGEKEQALGHYREMVNSLAQLRQGFWQPEVAGSYLKRPSGYLNRAVVLSAISGHHAEALGFIEEMKAQTNARQLQAQALFHEFNLLPPKAREMMAEIRWLQRDLRSAEIRPATAFRSDDAGDKYGLLRDKIAAYTRYINRLHRERLDSSEMPPYNGFEVEQFRRQAAKHLGQNWLALDFYRAGEQLICLLLTPETMTAHPIDLSPDLDMALGQLSRFKNGSGLPPVKILKGAGEVLIPAAVQDYLDDDNRPVMLISPHRELHRLPWAALHINGSSYRPLIEAVTPVVVPSLQTLSLLWQRPEQDFSFSEGLLLAVSAFENRQHSDLPAVGEEVRRLKPFIADEGRTLMDDEATAEAFIARVSGQDSPRGFWHIASHAFHDGQSGRLSGLALYDRDMFLDELWQLAPLPSLVTFSACGSSKSRLFEGDEHVGLTTTCLTAGANHVIGSIWNVLDKGMPGIMADFYTALLPKERATAVPVSEALAQAQRQAWARQENWQQWAGFRCTGRP